MEPDPPETSKNSNISFTVQRVLGPHRYTPPLVEPQPEIYEPVEENWTYGMYMPGIVRHIQPPTWVSNPRTDDPASVCLLSCVRCTSTTHNQPTAPLQAFGMPSNYKQAYKLLLFYSYDVIMTSSTTTSEGILPELQVTPEAHLQSNPEHDNAMYQNNSEEVMPDMSIGCPETRPGLVAELESELSDSTEINERDNESNNGYESDISASEEDISDLQLNELPEEIAEVLSPNWESNMVIKPPDYTGSDSEQSEPVSNKRPRWDPEYAGGPSIDYPSITNPPITYPSITHSSTTYPVTNYSSNSYLTASYPSICYPSTSHRSITYPSSNYPTINYSSTSYPSTSYPSTSYPSTSYPSTSYPSISYASTNYPSTSYESTNLPSTSYESTNLPSTSYDSTNYDPINFPSASYDSVNYPSTNYPSTNYPSTNYPSTNYPSTNYPPTNYPPTNYPPTNYPSTSDLSTSYDQVERPAALPIKTPKGKGRGKRSTH